MTPQPPSSHLPDEFGNQIVFVILGNGRLEKAVAEVVLGLVGDDPGILIVWAKSPASAIERLDALENVTEEPLDSRRLVACSVSTDCTIHGVMTTDDLVTRLRVMQVLLGLQP